MSPIGCSPRAPSIASSLRQDNADQRLTPVGHSLGLASYERLVRMQASRRALDALIADLDAHSAEPAVINPYLVRVGTTPIAEPSRLSRLALRPEVSLAPLLEASGHRHLLPDPPSLEPLSELAEVELKYAGYVERERETVRQLARQEQEAFPDGFDFSSVNAITMEARQKLSRIQPRTLGQASRISGVSPADIAALSVLLRHRRGGASSVSRETSSVS
jgi:tRNA uridine 5-carboxymethylaminomethyl modification enzyme